MPRILFMVGVAAMVALGAGLSTPAAASDIWVGRYSGRNGSYHWQATISGRSTGVYALHATVRSRAPPCAGEVDTVARSSGGRLIVADKDCSLTIAKRGATGIRVDERQCLMWHGAACEFTSDLARKQ